MSLVELTHGISMIWIKAVLACFFGTMTINAAHSIFAEAITISASIIWIYTYSNSFIFSFSVNASQRT